MAPSSSLAVRIDVAYETAAAIIRKPTPYVYGGGHPGFGPSLGDLKRNPRRLLGYDCSGFVSAVLKAGGLLRRPSTEVAFNVAEFEVWGVQGEGELTVWVRNDPRVQEHCFLEFQGFPSRYCEASHAGTDCRWLPNETFAGFKPRTIPADW
jgi:hypothetical protein